MKYKCYWLGLTLFVVGYLCGVLMQYNSSLNQRLGLLVVQADQVKTELARLRQRLPAVTDSTSRWPGPARYRAPRGGHIRLALIDRPAHALPGLEGSHPVLNALLFEGLVEYDHQWRLQSRTVCRIPSLANGLWRVDLPGQPHTMELTWRLRQGPRWSDGYPVTAADYICAWRLYSQSPPAGNTMPNRAKINRLVAPDPYTLVVHWQGYHARAACWGLRPLPAHLLRKANLQQLTSDNAAWTQRLVSNGPFCLVRWSERQIELKRNPYYFGPCAHAAGITCMCYEQLGTALKAMEQGHIDALVSPALSWPMAQRICARAQRPLRVVVSPGALWEHIDCNLDDPWLANPKLRQALLLAIDRQGLVKLLFGEHGQVAHSWLPPQHEGYCADITHYPFDPARAKQLLVQSGWQLNAQGQRCNQRGEHLQLSLVTVSDHRQRRQIAQFIQKAWQAIGISVVVNYQPAERFFQRIIAKRRFPHMALYAWRIAPSCDGWELWHSAAIPCATNHWQGANYPGLRNVLLDRLLNRIPHTIDQLTRITLLHKQQARWARLLPALPLFYYPCVSITVEGFRNWKPSGTDIPVSWNAEEWFIE